MKESPELRGRASQQEHVDFLIRLYRWFWCLAIVVFAVSLLMELFAWRAGRGDLDQMRSSAAMVLLAISQLISERRWVVMLLSGIAVVLMTISLITRP